MARKLFDIGIFDALNANGSFASGATLAFYSAGSATPIDTFNAPTAGSTNAKPVVADAYGRFDEIWIEAGQSIKYVFTPYVGATPISVDNFPIDSSSTTIAVGLQDFIEGNSPLPIANGGTASSSASTARSALGLAIGTNVQAWDADLDAIAALATTSFGRSLLTGANAAAVLTLLGAAGTISAASIADPGYISFLVGANTFTLQWGHGSLTTGASATITFAPAYSTFAGCIAAGGDSTNSHQGDVHATAVTTTTASITSSNNINGVDYWWIAWGK